MQEGAGESPAGPVADYVHVRSGKVEWWRAPRLLRLNEGSADLAVVYPFEMLLELKSRPDYGTKSQAQFQAMDADISRVEHHPEAAFLFVFDPRIYLSSSGEKVETSGRPALAAGWFLSHFPPRDQVVAQGRLSVTAVRGNSTIEMLFAAVPHHTGEQGILTVGCRTDASL